MAVEHPPPTAATIKLLYAHAFACAYPGCDRPLYREDSLAGAWTLNSRICHICARREGGPRWDPAQPAEDNRAEHNLLLMCVEHASAIDDLKAWHAYPAPLLREWKKSQIDDYRRRMEGWPLTTAMAEQAIAASLPNVGIAINHSTVQLGGEGGRAPGAGGGGGGAMGYGARAGQGGKGGERHNIGPHPPLPSKLEETLRFAVLDSEFTPGAGGAGSGAIGDGAVGGDGGSGGDSIVDRIAVTPGDTLEFEVGRGGEGATLPGQHGGDGGDTLVRVRSPDGTSKRTIRAVGGKGAMAGELPEGSVEISQADLDNGFQISTLLLANAVDARDSLLFILGGGWSKYNVPTLPYDAMWPVVCTATWRKLDPGSTRWLQLCILDPKGSEVWRTALELQSKFLSGTSQHWLVPIAPRLDSEGQWMVRVQSGGSLLSQIEVSVELAR